MNGTITINGVTYRFDAYGPADEQSKTYFCIFYRIYQ